MKRVRWYTVLLLVGILIFVGGCTDAVTQEEYDAAVAERDAAEAQVASLQGDLAAAVAERDATEAQVVSLQSDLAAAERELATVEEQEGEEEEEEVVTTISSNIHWRIKLSITITSRTPF